MPLSVMLRSVVLRVSLNPRYGNDSIEEALSMTERGKLPLFFDHKPSIRRERKRILRKAILSTDATMKVFLQLCVAVLATFMPVGSAATFPTSGFDVVMRGGDIIDEMDDGEFPVYRGGKCIIRFSRDGNLATQNGFLTGGWDANQNSFCGSPGNEFAMK